MTGVGVRDAARERPGIRPSCSAPTSRRCWTPIPDLVVELMGGIEPARELILRALKGGASVVTANKALLATDGAALHAAAEEAGVDLYYEAAVAGAIPLLRPLRESLAGDRIRRVLGIVNGTTNYILTQMDATGAAYADALAEAQALGYAEADPTADVEGHDAAAKAAILAVARLPHPGHARRRATRGHHRGHRRGRRGRRRDGLRHQAAGHRRAHRGSRRRGVSVRVHPALVPRPTRWPASATRSTRSSSRPTPPAR